MVNFPALFCVLPGYPDAIDFKWYTADVAGKPLVAGTIQRIADLCGISEVYVLKASPAEAALLTSHTPALNLHFLPGAPQNLLAYMASQKTASSYVIMTPMCALASQSHTQRMLSEMENGASFTYVHGTVDGLHPYSVSSELVGALISAGYGSMEMPGAFGTLEWLRNALQQEIIRDHLAEEANHAPRVVAVTLEESGVPRFELSIPIDSSAGLNILRQVIDDETSPSGTGILGRFCRAALTEKESRRATVIQRSRRWRTPRSNRRTSLLFVSGQSAFSGAEASACALLENLPRNQFVVHALVGLPGLFSERLAAANAGVTVAMREFRRPVFENISYIADVLDAHAVDLVHMNNVDHPAVVLAARMQGIPVVSHMRVYADAVSADSAGEVDHVIAVSRSVRDDLILAGVHPSRVSAVYNGIAPEYWKDSAAACKNAHQIIMPANIGPGKQQHLLIEAMAAILESVPTAHATLVGEVLDWTYCGKLYQMIAERGLEGHVAITGFQSDMKPYYAQGGVFVLCSQREPLARSILEALCCRVPVLATHTGGTSEIIEDGINGLLFDSPAQLATQAIRLIKDRRWADQLAQVGIETVTAKFSLSQYVNGVLAVYERILGQQPVKHLHERATVA